MKMASTCAYRPRISCKLVAGRSEIITWIFQSSLAQVPKSGISIGAGDVGDLRPLK